MRKLKVNDLLLVKPWPFWAGTEFAVQTWEIIRIDPDGVTFIVDGLARRSSFYSTVEHIRATFHTVKIINHRKSKLGKILYR